MNKKTVCERRVSGSQNGNLVPLVVSALVPSSLPYQVKPQGGDACALVVSPLRRCKPRILVSDIFTGEVS